MKYIKAEIKFVEFKFADVITESFCPGICKSFDTNGLTGPYDGTKIPDPYGEDTYGSGSDNSNL